MSSTECPLEKRCFPSMQDAHVLEPMDAEDTGLRLFIHGGLGISGVLLNVTCISVLVRTGLIRQWTYGMILNFCLSDLVFSSVMVMVLPGVMSGRWLYNDVFCRLMWTLFASTLSVTSLSFMLTTIHRYVTIVRTHNSQQSPIFSARWLPALTGTLWLIALLGGLTLTVFGPTRALFWSDLCFVDNSELYWVGMIVLGIFVTVPFLSVPILYVRILKFIYRVSRQVGIERQTTNRGHRTAVVLFILFGTFSLAFVPYFIRGFIVGLLSFSVLKRSFLITWLLLAAVSTINPVLFMSLFKPIRNGFVSMFCKRWRPNTKVHVFVTSRQEH